MNKQEKSKTKLALFLPFLLFVAFPIPYARLNKAFIVKWLGCGCPKIDESGNMIDSYFSANSFTALFWFFVTIGATVWAVLLARRIPKEKAWLRTLYAAAVFIMSILLSYLLTGLMMWD